MKKIISAILVFLILISTCSCGDLLSSEFHLTTTVDHTHHFGGVINVTLSDDKFDMPEDNIIEFDMGIGTDWKYEKVYPCTVSSVVTVDAPGCFVNDSQHTYSKEYPDLFTDKKYIASDIVYIVNSATVIPSYHEKVSIKFEDGASTGVIVFTLKLSGDVADASGRSTYCEEAFDIEIYYAKSGTKIAFDKNSIENAEKRLNGIF